MIMIVLLTIVIVVVMINIFSSLWDIYQTINSLFSMNIVIPTSLALQSRAGRYLQKEILI